MTIKRVESYQADDGTLHPNIQSAVEVNITDILTDAIAELGYSYNPPMWAIEVMARALITQPYRARIIQQLQELS